MKNYSFIFLGFIWIFLIFGWEDEKIDSDNESIDITTGNVNQALLSGTINTGVKHQTGKGVSEHMVQSLNEPIDCSMTSSNELAEMFFDDYNNLDCYLEKN